MMRKIIVLSFMLMLAWSVFAQQTSDKAKEILTQTSTTYKESGTLSVFYTMHIKDTKENVSESFDGVIDIKGTKMHINTPDMEIWFDGKTQWIWQREYEELTISQPVEEEINIMNPSLVIDAYRENAVLKYLGEKTDIRGRKVHEIELVPNDKNSDISKIVVQISEKRSYIYKIYILNKNNIENTIHIDQYTIHAGHKDSLFICDTSKFPDAEIIDLR